MRETPTPLRAPRDGIHSSQRRRGWLADAWLAILDAFDASSQQRIARGRGLARAGRVRDLWFSPGLATAEVVERETRHVSLRVRVFDETAWKRAVELLEGRLDFVAALLEAELPEELVASFAKSRLPLLPSVKEFDGDCDCGDYALPCAHMAAVHVLLADALDGDPFLLLTLRGRPREQILAALRSSWGDRRPLTPLSAAEAEPVPTVRSWFRSQTSLPPMDFHPVAEEGGPPTGLRELGPAPDGEDLERTLGPLYEAGAVLAEAIAMQEGPTASQRRSFHSVTADPAPLRTFGSGSEAPAPVGHDATPLPPDGVDLELTEAVLEALADGKGYRATDLTEVLGVGLPAVRRLLRRLEEHGLIERSGRTRGTRWKRVESGG